MNPTDLVATLVSIDQIETWKDMTPQLTKEQRIKLFAIAEPLWLEKQAKSNKLYMNLAEIEKLKANRWVPTDKQRQMIWASVFASIHSSAEPKRFETIREALKKKYGKKWWQECDARAKHAHAAKEWITKKILINRTAAKGSLILDLAEQEQVDKVLSKIPN